MCRYLQATVTLLENIDILMAKTPKADIKSDVLPMVYNSFESTAPQIQCASIRAAAHVAEYLDENAVRKMVLPRTRSVFETNSGQRVSRSKTSSDSEHTQRKARGSMRSELRRAFDESALIFSVTDALLFHSE